MGCSKGARPPWRRRAKAWTIEGLGPLTMELGDVLYLPAGTEQSAEAQTAASPTSPSGFSPSPTATWCAGY